ncbi:hypothetical protein V2G26_006914 [Clonostachys chloroleuca]
MPSVIHLDCQPGLDEPIAGWQLARVTWPLGPPRKEKGNETYIVHKLARDPQPGGYAQRPSCRGAREGGAGLNCLLAGGLGVLRGFRRVYVFF